MTQNPQISAEPVLSCRGLTVRFGGLVAVRGVDLDVHGATIHALIGPNGAGKSTLINCLTGFVKASGGETLLAGRPVAGKAAYEVAELGMARTFQNIRLFGGMTVLENVLVGCHRNLERSILDLLFRRAKAAEEEARFIDQARELLAFVGLNGRDGQLAGSLAYGHQRRLEIARALMLAPSVLLLDEPMAGMNVVEKAELAELISQIRADGTAILLVEHDVEIVRSLSDRVTVLHHGEKIADGPPDRIFADARVQSAYLGREVTHAEG
jgi:branched-chain amino acid transport system ATP-binding protein